MADAPPDGSPILAALGPEALERALPGPMPPAVKAMAATSSDRRFSDPAWIFEEKLDGYRCLAWVDDGEVRLRSRNDLDLAGAFPELIDALAHQVTGSVVLDGEVVAFVDGRSSFDLLQRRAGLRDPRKARATDVAISYQLFDVVWADGYDLRPLPLRDRKRALDAAVHATDPLAIVAFVEGEGEAAFDAACRAGREGVIAKRAASAYQPRRSRDWLKLKCTRSQELVVVGFTDPKGGRTGFGALLVGYGEDGVLRFAGKVGTGFDDETLRTVRPLLDEIEVPERPVVDEVREPGVHWVLPAPVAQVGFAGWTDDGKLRHPRFEGFRTDKSPGDVVREPTA